MDSFLFLWFVPLTTKRSLDLFVIFTNGLLLYSVLFSLLFFQTTLTCKYFHWRFLPHPSDYLYPTQLSHFIDHVIQSVWPGLGQSSVVSQIESRDLEFVFPVLPLPSFHCHMTANLSFPLSHDSRSFPSIAVTWQPIFRHDFHTFYTWPDFRFTWFRICNHMMQIT